MDVVAVLLAVAAVLLCSVYVGKFWARRRKKHSLIDKIPGPPAYPIVGTTYLFFGKPRNRIMQLFRETAEKYQPIFRTWFGSNAEIALTRPEDFETIINSTRHLTKAGIYKFLMPWLGTGLVTSSGQKWHSHRKMITPAFHLSILDNFVEVFCEKCEILVEKLEQKANGSGFDILPYVTRCALDVICDTAMGVQIHAQEDTDSEYVKKVSELAVLTIRRREKVWLHSDFIFYLSPMGRRYAECLNTVKGFTRKVIQERKAALANVIKNNHESSDEDRSFGIRRKKAFLDLLLEYSGKEDLLSDEDLREEVDTFMFAGHDTTSVTSSWVLFMLGHHPEVQERAYAELSEIFQGSQRSPTMKDLHEMKYLERVIKETLRVYPTVPAIQRFVTEDVHIGGYDIPAGTTVSILIFFANLNPEYFPNPDKFDPDHFLPERVQKRHHFAFVPFSAGPRNCIGQRFAMLEMKTILSYILRKFKIRSLESTEEVKQIPAIVMKPENGIKVTLTSRN